MLHEEEAGRWILLPPGGYSYGVEARGKGWRNVELHGGFKTYEEADARRARLLREYSDYEYAKVVKIETPEASKPEPVLAGPDPDEDIKRVWF